MSDAWSDAHGAASAAGVRLAPLGSLEDADAVIDVMVATWGAYQTLPREVIRALAESGNVPWGAFEVSTLVGYVLGWAGVDGEGLHVHSHMLAVLPGRRHSGVGYALKLAQRAQALEQGIGVARWTFDPMIARNAYFNLCKLGVVADRFEPNFYGEMSDQLNRGERSDRLVVRWDLEREPGARPLPPGDALAVLAAAPDGEDVRPVRERHSVAVDDTVLVAVPRDYPALKERRPELAAAWRDAVADALGGCFALGLRVVGFDLGGTDRWSSYVLTRPVGAADRPGS